MRDFQMDTLSIKHTLERHIDATAQLFRGSDNRVYARFRSESSTEIVSIEAPRFGEWLTEYCIDNSLPPNKTAVKSLVSSLMAKEHGPAYPVRPRVGASCESDIYLDLSDGSGRAVHVSKNGWTLVEQPQVLFPTHSNQYSLPVPKKGGAVRGLGKMFDLSPQNEALIASFCLACLKGVGPYPPLLIVGPDDGGSTMLASYLRTVLDPSVIQLRNLPKNEGELVLSASLNHILAYDDVQTIPPWLEMAFCKLSKGTTFLECRGGHEQVRSQGAKPIILAGSEELLLHRELVSRA